LSPFIKGEKNKEIPPLDKVYPGLSGRGLGGDLPTPHLSIKTKR